MFNSFKSITREDVFVLCQELDYHEVTFPELMAFLSGKHQDFSDERLQHLYVQMNESLFQLIRNIPVEDRTGIHFLDISSETMTRLMDCGIYTVGDLMKRSSAQITEQHPSLTADVIKELRAQANGRRRDTTVGAK